MNTKVCPCGTNKVYSACCEPVVTQRKLAKTPEQLMRSRFSAYFCNHAEWIARSWLNNMEPESVAFDDDLKWLDLNIIDAPKADSDEGYVEFEARYLKKGKVKAIHEKSRFIKQNNQWLYVDGEYLQITFKEFKVGRNDSCPCLSGLKYKACCGAEL